MSNSRPTTNIALILIVLLVVAAIGWYITTSSGLLTLSEDSLEESTVATPTDISPETKALYAADASDAMRRLFQTAESALTRGDYSTGRDLLEKILMDNPDLPPTQQAHIDYKIALSYTEEDQVRAVSLLQELTRNEEYPEQQKAYAVQHMYTVWRFFSIENAAAVKEQMFSEEFASFLVPTSTSRSMYNLNQHALSYGTAPFSEIEIAHYEAGQLLKEQNDLDEESLADRLDSIEIKVASVEDYIDRNRGQAPNAGLEPRILQSLAATYGRLVQAGLSEYAVRMDETYQRGLEAEDTISQRLLMAIAYAYSASFTDDEAINERAQAALTETLAVDRAPLSGVITWLLLHKDPEIDDTFIVALNESNEAFSVLLQDIGYFNE